MSGAVLLKPAPPVKRKAREIVIAPRLPERSKFHTGNPFTSEGDVVVECDAVDAYGNKCGWNCMGPRADVRAAVTTHRGMYHPESIGVFLLNAPRQ